MARSTPTKSARIASQLRAEIVAGRLQPGASLPTWDRMEAQFDAGRPTLTRAMAELKEDGFIHATRSKGTFVAERPPHLVRYGLVFPSHPSIAYTGMGRWNRFWEMLSLLAPVVGEELDLEMPVYFNIGSGLGKDEELLAEDLERARLGGLITVSSDTHHHPLLRDTTIPQVMVAAEEDPSGIPAIYVDRQNFVERSMAIMRENGRRRVAVMMDRFFAFRLSQHTVVKTGTEDVPWHDVHQQFSLLMAANGFESPPYWHLMLTPSTARNAVRLLFQGPPETRPDGLIIGDDNLTAEALAGLVETGIDVQRDLTVVSHCNWPAATHPLVPTIGLGYDVRQFLRLCVESLQTVQAGGTVPTMQRVAAELQPSFTPSHADVAAAAQAVSMSQY